MSIPPKNPAYSGHRKMMNVTQVAEYLGVTDDTVRLWMSEGMPHRKLGHRTVRFYDNEVDQWVDQRHQSMSPSSVGSPPPASDSAPQGASPFSPAGDAPTFEQGAA